jgi:FkbM family methyltransferase
MTKTLKWLVDRFFIKQPRLRRAVTYLFEGNSERQIDVFGTTLTVNTIKEHGYVRAFRMCQRSSLLRDEVAVLINLAFLIGEHDTFVDIGANVGVFARTVCRLKKILPSIRVYAFEANPDTYRRLVHNSNAKMRAEQVALSDCSGVLEFVEGAVSHVFTRAECANAYHVPGRKTLIPTRRLDECAIDGDSLIIKVDVEGQEMNVLRGGTRLFEANRVKAVYIDGYEDSGVEGLLRGYGFRLFDGRSLDPAQGKVFSLLAIHPAKQAGLENQLIK